MVAQQGDDPVEDDSSPSNSRGASEAPEYITPSIGPKARLFHRLSMLALRTYQERVGFPLGGLTLLCTDFSLACFSCGKYSRILAQVVWHD